VRSLIITQYAPLPPAEAVDGVYKRLRLFVNALAKISDRIDFLGLVPEADVQAFEGPQLSASLSSYWGHSVNARLSPTRLRKETNWNHYGAGIFSAGEQPGFYHFTGQEQVEAVRTALSNKPDLTFVFRLGAMLPVLRAGIKPARMFFDLDDLEHVAKVRNALARPRTIGKTIYCAHAPALLLAEHKAAKLSNGIFVCSEKDRAHLHRLGFGRKVQVVPNAIPIPALNGADTDEESLLYIGTFRYKPNIDGAVRLLTKIWPLVRARRPKAKLIIAGKRPDQIPGFDPSLPGVEFTGFVQDLDALYARSGVIVCPLLVGAGTRIKLLEAASFAKPMVSTTIGAEGLNFQDGSEILIRDEDAGFAQACCDLLESASLRNKLGSAARKKVSETYGASETEQKIADLMMT
jgi:glycosyltransferase involved in cell wall biosynthesis